MAWRRRSRSPREDGAVLVTEGRRICELLSGPRSGLLEAREALLERSGAKAPRLSQALRGFFQRLRGDVRDEAPRLLLACWVSVLSWDADHVASTAWARAADARAARALPRLLPLVPSLFGLFALLQVVEPLPEAQALVAEELRRRAAGLTCPVCLEALGDELLVKPCSHAVHWHCYAEAVRSKTCVGRCLMCRKVCNWSNVILDRLLPLFRSLALETAKEAQPWPSEPPVEYLVASICADLSEHLPRVLAAVPMGHDTFAALQRRGHVEVAADGTWLVARALELPQGRVPVASTLLEVSSLDRKVCYNEWQLQSMGGLTVTSLFRLLGATEVLMTWKAPLPAQMFWSSEFQKQLEAQGLRVSKERLLDLLEDPDPGIYSRLSILEGSDTDFEAFEPFE